MSARAAICSGRIRHRRQVLRLALVVEREHGLRPELLLLRDEQRRLHLIVDGLVGLPERERRLLPVRERHLLPEACGGRRGGGRVSH